MQALSEVAPGRSVSLVSIEGGRNMRAKLCHMGLVPGASFTVIKGHDGGGPVILKVKETRLAIGQGMAQRMMVE
jgi:ferrous iron transport protein A